MCLGLGGSASLLGRAKDVSCQALRKGSGLSGGGGGGEIKINNSVMY